VLYTSGSTGRPKGVIYTHRFVLHIALRYTNGQHLSYDDRLSLLLSASYSASVGNVFGGLLNGATLSTFDLKEQGFDRLARWLRDEEISVYYSVPTLFRRLASSLAGRGEFPRLRLIRLGGEAVYRGDVELYKKHFHDDCILHIGLGTTETNTVREYFVDKQTDCAEEIVPVGYAMEDIEVLLLDGERRPVGPGRTGEIAVRSRFMSQGYWRRPELTKASFVTDPEDERLRVYLTGDLGRMADDGCLTHLGRKDSQVKVRGYRVEASEIEVALMNLEAVSEAVVMARQDEKGENRLSAYVAACGA